ncbi:MAG: AbrB family transcriptional regulator [Deltaproteobacteria bacterium RIFOXYD12_FULL_50_9]|nr:MAG: AbrB family transcriptional regulator [Deltaproteobacteria bacterium RIFOXYD12_FULL_50_9]
MQLTVLSSKGQVIIPKPVRTARHWEPGQQLEVVDTDEGILLRPAKPFSKTSLEEVTSCLNYQGKTISLAEMEEAIRKGVEETTRDRG